MWQQLAILQILTIKEGQNLILNFVNRSPNDGNILYVIETAAFLKSLI
jgi:hypothetical protein